MKGLAVDPMRPHIIADFSTREVIGGITFELFKIFANHHGITFDVFLETDWLLMNEDGTLGGMVGTVC